MRCSTPQPSYSDSESETSTLQSSSDATSSTVEFNMSGVPAEMPEWFQTVWTEVRTMQGHIAKIPALQDNVTAVEGKVTEAVARIESLEADSEVVKGRLEVLEDQKKRELPANQVRPSIFELMTREETRLERLIMEAGSMAGMVIIGKQPSAPADKYSEDAVKSLVTRISGSGTTFTARGSTGVYAVAFRKVAASTPEHRAKRFLQTLSSLKVSRLVWAQLDRPKELRDHDRRARAFGRSFKAKLVDPSAAPGAKSPVFFTVEKGFLVINDTVIAPISLVPDEEVWPQLSKSLVPQLNKRIAQFVYDVYTAVPEDFLEPETVDPSELYNYELNEDSEPMQQDLHMGDNDWDDLFAPLDGARVPPNQS